MEELGSWACKNMVISDLHLYLGNQNLLLQLPTHRYVGDHLVSVREIGIVGHLVNIPIIVNFVSINNSVYRIFFLAKLYNIQ